MPILTYQYRLYPRKAQKQVLEGILQSACFVYNHALAYRRKKWSESRKHVSYNELAGMWRDWRNEQAEDNPLRLLNMSAGQQVLRRLDKSFASFFRRVKAGQGGGFPRFKKAARFNSVDYSYGDGGIAIEKLNLSFMLQGNKLSRSVHDAGLGLFTQLLHSKAESAGCVVVEVNPRNTSQACSGCSCIVKKALKVRTHDCPHCGLVLDRDLNAARNIYFLAFETAWTEPSGVNVRQ